MGELVLVTGASGYIATHVVQQLLTEGYKVRATVRNLANDAKTKSIQDLAGETNRANLELVEANLTDAHCWNKVVQDCDYVLHTASPFPADNPKHEDELIKPAVEGTLNVLRACGPSVKRVVLTSSVAAISAGHDHPPNGKSFTEEDWTNTNNTDMVYDKSKTLAEKAAWDYMKSRLEGQNFELTVVNPALVLGPVLCHAVNTSVEIIRRMMIKDMPLLPRLNFAIIDVRDVAASHISAIKIPEASGRRHILSGANMWFKDIAKIIEKEFKPLGYSIPTSNAPYGLLWILGRFDASVKMLLPSVGNEQTFDNSRMVQVLGIQPRPVEATILDTCYSLVEAGKVKKTAKYTTQEQRGTTL